MIKLSERLRLIADRLDNCKTMADIGTDHGFLPAYLVESGRCSHAIAADISQPSLDKARMLCIERGIKNCEIRAGDGLAVLSPGEVDGVVIAGMGGNLIVDIISGNREVADKLKRIVMQPRTASGYLRRWLMDNNFRIIAEDVVHEGRFIPQIITAVPSGVPLDGAEDMSAEGTSGCGELYYEIPEWIVRGSGPVDEHIKRVITREKNTLEGLMTARKKDEGRIADKEAEIIYLNGLLNKIESGKTVK